MIAHGPPPTVSIEDALRSTTAREQRDRELAAWCGLAEDEVEPFLARLRAFDARTPAWIERCALDDARRAREERAKLAPRLGVRLTERL